MSLSYPIYVLFLRNVLVFQGFCPNTHRAEDSIHIQFSVIKLLDFFVDFINHVRFCVWWVGLVGGRVVGKTTLFSVVCVRCVGAEFLACS